MARYLLPLTILPVLASCVAPQRATPAPTPVLYPAPAPAAPVTAAPVSDRYAGDWSVDPLTPGSWQRRPTTSGFSAVFVDGGGDAIALIGCSSSQIVIARFGEPGEGAAAMAVRTSFARRDLTGTRVGGPAPSLYGSASARDLLWDQIIYSRGRFLVEATGMAPVILPTRPEIARVVEDCRDRETSAGG